MKPAFSIIIPCRNMSDYLKESVSHIQKLKFENFEVLIVLDKYETYDFGGDKRFKIFESGSVGPGRKRNIGASKAISDVLVFLDDDAYPHPEWLSNAHRIFEDSKVYALGAPALTPPNATFLEKMGGRVLESFFTSAGTIYRHIPRKAREVDDYPSVNLFVRKDLFLELGGFNEDFWPGEDTKLCLDMIKKMNKSFPYDPTPIVYHHRRALFVPHLKQISRYARHRGQFAKIFPETSRKLAYFVPSLFVLWLFLGPIISIFLRLTLPLYIFSLWFYMLILAIEGVRVIRRDSGFLTLMYFMQGVFLTHVVYGINFIIGLIKKPQLELRAVDKKTGNYLGG